MRLRITFNKTEAMRYTGHLDLHRAWERTFRRAKLPLAYSQGFHPQPRLNLASALPLGFTSECEMLDTWLETDIPIEEIMVALQHSLPPGIIVKELREVDPRLPALQTQVQSAEYMITLLEPPRDLAMRLERIKKATNLPRVRRNKPYDLQPLIEKIDHLIGPDGIQCITLRIAAREANTGRPEEVLAELGIPFEEVRVHRIKILFGEKDE